MHVKILEEHTMQKNHAKHPVALTVISQEWHTVFALTVVSMQVNLYMSTLNN